MERDRWGRPLIIPPKGGKPVGYRRVTTFISALSDHWALNEWSKEQVAIGMGMDLTLPQEIVQAGGDRDQYRNIAKRALAAAGGTVKADYGTLVHMASELLESGARVGEDNITEMVNLKDDATDEDKTNMLNLWSKSGADIEADAESFMRAAAHLATISTEQFVVHDDYTIAGTVDRVVADGARGRMVGDIKTGSIDYDQGKMAMQLRAYALSQRYTPDGQRLPSEVTNPDQGYIFHVKRGEAHTDVYLVDLIPAQRGLQMCADVWQWRKLTKWLQTVNVDEGPSPVDLIRIAADRTAIENIWRQYKDTDAWTDECVHAAQQRIKEIEG